MSAIVAAHERTGARWRLGPPWRDVVVAVVVVGAVTAAAWLRLPPIARDTLWAEDGRTFLGAAVGPSAWGTILQPYAGYLHLVPRLLALLTVSAVPVAGWALSMTFLSCLVAGIVAGVVLLVSRPYVTWLPARLLLAGLTVLTPLASREVLGNTANLHSLLFWAAFWLVLSRPSGGRAGWALAPVALVCALTEIQTLLLVPLLLLHARDRRTWPVKAALAAGILVQLGVTIGAPRPHGSAPPDGPVSDAFGWLINAVVTSWVPRGAVGGLVAALGPWLAVLLVIPAASIAVSFVAGRREHRLAAVALLVEAVAVWTASVLLNPKTFYEYATPAIADSGHVWLSRYGVVPAMMLLAESVIAIDAIRRRGTAGRGTAGRGTAIGLAVVLAAVLAVQAPTSDTRRSAGPEWQPQIAAARDRCAAGADEVRLRETLGWTVTVPCRYLAARPPTARDRALPVYPKTVALHQQW